MTQKENNQKQYTYIMKKTQPNYALFFATSIFLGVNVLRANIICAV